MIVKTEKDELMMRNAELSQQLTSTQQILQDEKKVFEEEKQHLEKEVTEKTSSEETLKQTCQQYETEVSLHTIGSL